MAIVMLGLNGIGLGHLARTVCMADALSGLGQAPVIFAQGTSSVGEGRYPGKRIPHLHGASRRERALIAREISRYAGMSRPSIVFEDTHPAPLALEGTVRRILVVRPTTFDYMRHLQRRYAKTYAAFLLADAPNSPTWPFGARETAAILSWEKWHVIGPVFRRPSADELRGVAERYGITAGDPVCVVSMGAGGTKSPRDPDAARLFAAATRLQAKLRRAEPRTRMLFARGPLAPPRLRVPEAFEIVSGEMHADALVALARGAVIRPGFNTTWECIAGGTPFVAVPGRTYREPVDARVAKLRALGYEGDFAEHWAEPEWIARQEAAVAATASRWSGVPDLAVLERCLVDDADALPTMRPRKRVPQPRRARLQLVVRVDDVVALDAPLLRLLQRLSEAQFAASLEVVPALCRFADADLDILDAGHLFTVGQHGYAHIPRVTDTPEQLAAGRAMLLQRFPTRFHGGLSAPYDRVPEWLGATWRELGGAFLSCITAKPPAGAIPLVRVGTEAWDWARDRRRSIARIVGDLERQSRRNGYAGLVFHPWLLARPGEDEHLARLLDALARAGAVGASIAGVAR